MTGAIRKVFPGGNTPKGFFSFYDYIVKPTANRIFIIKGGPGVGKSSFMKSVAETLVNSGFDVEHHHCSSDNNSLDGIYVPKIDIAMVDGTAPHIVDPKNPGAVDEIINLGDFWNIKNMAANREMIISANKEVGRLFRFAYRYLGAAKACMDQVESIYMDSGSLDIARLNKAAFDIISEIFDGNQFKSTDAKARHLFGSAITPEGPRHHLETLVSKLKKRYLISGDWGTGRSTIVKKVADYALAAGWDAEIFHCPMDPEKYDHIIIPALGVAVMNNSVPHSIEPQKGDTLVDTSYFVNTSRLRGLIGDINDSRYLFTVMFEKAITYIARAKKIHDELETYYIPNMDFKRISEVRERILSRILAIANELK